MSMKAKIKRIEEGVVLVSDETLFDHLDDGAEVEVSTNGSAVVLTPVSDVEREPLFRQSAEKIIDKHAGLFERLSK